MSVKMIAAVVYADGIYPDRAMAAAIAPLEDFGLPLAGALQVTAAPFEGRHPCDMLLKDLASGDVAAIAEERGRHAGGCRLDVGVLTEIGEKVRASLSEGRPRLLVVNKFGKMEAAGGGLRGTIVEAIELGIPVLVGVPARNLDSWRAFAGPLADELEVDSVAILQWLSRHDLGAPKLDGRGVARVARGLCRLRSITRPPLADAARGNDAGAHAAYEAGSERSTTGRLSRPSRPSSRRRSGRRRSRSPSRCR